MAGAGLYMRNVILYKDINEVVVRVAIDSLPVATFRWQVPRFDFE